jgi:hypothetical protein
VRIPRTRFQPIPGGICNSNVISQEAKNFLTKCIWEKSPEIFTPKKLMSAATPTCLDFEHVAIPMVLLVTGKTISSYKRLMKDPMKRGRRCLAKILAAWHKAITRQDNRGLTPFLS